MVSWRDLLSVPADVRFEPVAFEHPLWILYSSGTTGLPKSMVQGHGGIVLEHLKSLALHLDLGAGDRFCWFTTTGWMMWNFLVSGLLVGATVVLYDGSPAYPDLGALWRLVERAGLTYLGSSAPFIHASMQAEVEPRSLADLSTLRAIGSTGAPLSPEGFGWVNDRVGSDVWLGSISGGTDLCTRRRDVVSMAARASRRDPVPGARREGGVVRPARTSDDRRGRRARRSPSRCPRCPSRSGTTPAATGTARATSTCTRASGVTGTGSRSRRTGRA